MTFEEKLEKARELVREAFAELREMDRGGEGVVYICVDRETGNPIVDENEFFEGALGEDWDPGEGAWRPYIPLHKKWD